MSDKMEYVFFEKELAEKFVDFCQQLGVKAMVAFEETPMGEDSFIVQVQQALTDSQTDALEDEYSEMLFGEQAALIEGNDDLGVVADACGVQVVLSNGDYTTIAIHPIIMNKILSVLSIDELQKFLAQVAEDIEHPKAGPICSRVNLPQL